MHKSRRRNERITFSTLVWYVQPGTTSHHSCIDWQGSPRELLQDLLLQPLTQHGSMGGVLALNLQDAKLQFHDGYD
jgi:hypothetical protein